MSSSGILPEGENLRKAVKWISGQGGFSLKTVEAACVRFDLSPADENFLINHFSGEEAEKEKGEE
ncbi:MAG: hypothetical protein OEV42_18580 [Deltaproteobacteria bacterium]|nr:hypothetical protein [Deltaproteobacteria bacterium]